MDALTAVLAHRPRDGHCPIRLRSSVGKSSRLLSGRSQVRILPESPTYMNRSSGRLGRACPGQPRGWAGASPQTIRSGAAWMAGTSPIGANLSLKSQSLRLGRTCSGHPRRAVPAILGHCSGPMAWMAVTSTAKTERFLPKLARIGTSPARTARLRIPACVIRHV